MAGILSKGITLGYKPTVLTKRWKHTITFQNNDTSETMTMTLINDNGEELGGQYHATSNVFNGGVFKDGTDATGDAIVICYHYDANNEGGYFVCLDEETGGIIQVPVEYGEVQDKIERYYEKPTDFVTLTNLQEIAELGNNAPEKIDVTVLSDAEKKSIAGLTDTAQDLTFKFLYEKAQFATLAALNGSYDWRVTLPDGTTATFTATPSVKIAGVGVSAAMSYTLALSVESKIVFA